MSHAIFDLIDSSFDSIDSTRLTQSTGCKSRQESVSVQQYRVTVSLTPPLTPRFDLFPLHTRMKKKN